MNEASHVSPWAVRLSFRRQTAVEPERKSVSKSTEMFEPSADLRTDIWDLQQQHEELPSSKLKCYHWTWEVVNSELSLKRRHFLEQFSCIVLYKKKKQSKLDQKYNKNCKMLKYYYNLKCMISMWICVKVFISVFSASLQQSSMSHDLQKS